jgi:hypothetical protein
MRGRVPLCAHNVPSHVPAAETAWHYNAGGTARDALPTPSTQGLRRPAIATHATNTPLGKPRCVVRPGRGVGSELRESCSRACAQTAPSGPAAAAARDRYPGLAWAGQFNGRRAARTRAASPGPWTCWPNGRWRPGLPAPVRTEEEASAQFFFSLGRGSRHRHPWPLVPTCTRLIVYSSELASKLQGHRTHTYTTGGPHRTTRPRPRRRHTHTHNSTYTTDTPRTLTHAAPT